jgi:hypothetical protein
MDAAEIGAIRMKLTEEGCKMFPLNAVLHLHHFHRWARVEIVKTQLP